VESKSASPSEASSSSSMEGIVRSAHTISIEVMKNAMAGADEMSPSDMFATVCTALAVLLASYQIIQHLRHFNEPSVQLQIIRILVMIPVRLFPTAKQFVQELSPSILVFFLPNLAVFRSTRFLRGSRSCILR
jgi:predicted tellurium resistance membrane protein TerC